MPICPLRFPPSPRRESSQQNPSRSRRLSGAALVAVCGLLALLLPLLREDTCDCEYLRPCIQRSQHIRRQKVTLLILNGQGKP